MAEAGVTVVISSRELWSPARLKFQVGLAVWVESVVSDMTDRAKGGISLFDLAH